MRTKALELKRDVEKAEDLRREKYDLEKQIAEMKQEAVKVHATHACQIGKQVLSVIAF